MFKYYNVRVHILKIAQFGGGGVKVLPFMYYNSRDFYKKEKRHEY